MNPSKPHPLLNSLQSPKDLKKFNEKQLLDVCQELRDYIIEVMSVNGGHLATNLGAVEISVALHRTFSSPDDKIVFDTGHQSYSHKILTGRYDRFPTIRKYQGLCGFTNPEESPHDHFHAGHAGSALSQALGLAKERDLQGRHEEKVIAVIGDAALTCGLTLEALNNVSKDLKNFVVLLNDNAMAISENVGAITNILSRLLNNPQSNRFYKNIDKLVSKIPHVGNALSQQSHKLTESLKNLVSPAAFFEQYGLSYVGPIDGHDIHKLGHCLEAIKQESQPTLIHVLTNKGQGMANAVAQPTPYHGAKPFDLQTGQFLPSKSTAPTFPKVFGTYLEDMMADDSRIVVVNPAMTAGSCIEKVVKRFPDRAIDVGIAEGHCVTFAGALAKKKGLKVFCSVYSTFLQRAVDNVYHDICLQEAPVVLCLDRAGLATGDGITHHGIYDIGFLNPMPNLILSQPRNGKVLKELMHSSFKWESPAVIRYPNMACEIPEGPFQDRMPGEGEILRQGNDTLFIAMGSMVSPALTLAQKLENEGLMNPTVFDPVFIKPLDQESLLKLFQKHHQVVIFEEHAINCGLSAIISQFMVSRGLQDLKVLSFGIAEEFIHQGSYQNLLDLLGLSVDKMQKKIQSFFKLKKLATI